MPAKGKNRIEFSTCCVCNTIFCENAEFHQSHCVAMQKRHSTQGIKSDDFCFQQDYIHNEILYGSVHQSKELSKDILNGKKAVLMHISTMKLCKIHIFGYVVVQSYDSHNLYIVYPSTKICRTAIAFMDSRQKKYKIKEKVKVFPYYGKVIDAEKVLLSTVSPGDFYGDNFNKFLNQKLWNTYIYSGMSIHSVYKGSGFQLVIKEVEEEPLILQSIVKSEGAVEDECIPSLNTNFSRLTLNDSKLDETKFYSALETSVLESSQEDPSSFCSSSAHSICEKSSNTSLPFQSIESSTLNFKREFFIHQDVSEYFTFTSTTGIEIEFNEEVNKSVQENFKATFKDVGGLEKQKKIVKDYLKLFFEGDCISGLPHGMLFYGPSGVGKTVLAEAIAEEMKVNFIKVVASDVYIKNYINSANQVKHAFEEAVEKCPCVILIDEVDLLCDMFPNDKNGIISTIQFLMDKISVTEIKVFVIAAATSITTIDDSLLKTGCFEIEVKFEIPEAKEKKEILPILLRNHNHNLAEREFHEIAELSHGFSSFSLALMVMDAEFEKLCRYNGQNSDTSNFLIDSADLEKMLKEIKPHILNSDQYSFQKIYWEDIGGMEKVKMKLRRVVEFPLLYPQVFKRFDITPSRGVLLYGPPGCSKTMIAKALATESHLNFIPIKGAELFSKWVGDSEKAVRDLFKRAKEAAPCIIFFDEIDSLVPDRGSSGGSDVDKRVVTQLLTEIDGAEELAGVIVVAATNRPDRLDPAMLRPGRLDHLIYTPLPDTETRKAIFDLNLKTMPVGNDVDAKELVGKTCGYTGAEIVAVCQLAALLALSENFPLIVEDPVVQKHHFEETVKIIKPRIKNEVIQFYETFSSIF